MLIIVQFLLVATNAHRHWDIHNTVMRRYAQMLIRSFVALFAVQTLFTPVTASAVASLAYLERHTPRFAEEITAKYGEMINVAALLHDYDPRLITALIIVESEGKNEAVSRKGAIGLMQLMPLTARSMGAKDPSDPFQNILAGTKYLRDLERNYGFASTYEALVAYNMGPTRARRWLSEYDPESYAYVERIMFVERLLRDAESESNIAKAKMLRVADTAAGDTFPEARRMSLRPLSVSLAALPALLPSSQRRVVEDVD